MKVLHKFKNTTLYITLLLTASCSFITHKERSLSPSDKYINLDYKSLQEEWNSVDTSNLTMENLVLLKILFDKSINYDNDLINYSQSFSYIKILVAKYNGISNNYRNWYEILKNYCEFKENIDSVNFLNAELLDSIVKIDSNRTSITKAVSNLKYSVFELNKTVDIQDKKINEQLDLINKLKEIERVISEDRQRFK